MRSRRRRDEAPLGGGGNGEDEEDDEPMGGSGPDPGDDDEEGDDDEGDDDEDDRGGPPDGDQDDGDDEDDEDEGDQPPPRRPMRKGVNVSGERVEMVRKREFERYLANAVGAVIRPLIGHLSDRMDELEKSITDRQDSVAEQLNVVHSAQEAIQKSVSFFEDSAKDAPPAASPAKERINAASILQKGVVTTTLEDGKTTNDSSPVDIGQQKKLVEQAWDLKKGIVTSTEYSRVVSGIPLLPGRLAEIESAVNAG